MSDLTAALPSGLSDEQQHFVESIRDFFLSDTGTTEKLSELTNGFGEQFAFDLVLSECVFVVYCDVIDVVDRFLKELLYVP